MPWKYHYRGVILVGVVLGLFLLENSVVTGTVDAISLPHIEFFYRVIGDADLYPIW